MTSSEPSRRSRNLKNIFNFRSKLSDPANINKAGPLGFSTLHSPVNPRIELIFVHGLRGGSHKTWRATDDDSTFWPKAWLPESESFRDARIHTFGYDSDWATVRANRANMRDFAHSLLNAVEFSPVLRETQVRRSMQKLQWCKADITEDSDNAHRPFYGWPCNKNSMLSFLAFINYAVDLSLTV